MTNRTRNLMYAGIAGLSGGITVILVVGALLIGLGLDARFGVRGPFTIGLVVLSVPVSLLVMFRVVLSATRAVQRAAQGDTTGFGDPAKNKEG